MLLQSPSIRQTMKVTAVKLTPALNCTSYHSTDHSCPHLSEGLITYHDWKWDRFQVQTKSSGISTTLTSVASPFVLFWMWLLHFSWLALFSEISPWVCVHTNYMIFFLVHYHCTQAWFAALRNIIGAVRYEWAQTIILGVKICLGFALGTPVEASSSPPCLCHRRTRHEVVKFF